MSDPEFRISHQVNLADLATMHVPAIAKSVIQIDSLQDLDAAFEYLKTQQLPFLVLGGGSNMLFVGDYDGVILDINLGGIEIIEETNQIVKLKVSAGENWHQLVMKCVEKGLGGIENLALIPGKAGAAPIQNIGAYGVELADVFVELEAWMIEDKAVKIFSKSDCKFGYRESVFKSELKGKVVITALTIELSKIAKPKFDYAALKVVLEKKGISTPTIKQVCEAVIEVRESKLPDPNKLGNNGSFFKNPIIDVSHFNTLKTKFPEMPAYPVNEQKVKVPAGWLIDQAGWKGFREGDAGVHEKQALVLVNYGDATGKEIYNLSDKIVQDIKTKYQIQLIREVNIVGNL